MISLPNFAPLKYRFLAPLALALLLLAITAARLLYIAEIHLHVDELWSIWQGFGSLVDLIRWTPYDWPPLYYLVLDSWVALVGLEPVALRYLSVLCFMVGAAFLYQVIQREANVNAAVLVLLILGGIAFVKFLSTELRGYSIMLMTLPMAWFYAIHLYRKPKWWSILGFAVSAAASVYATYVSVLPISFFIGYSLWAQRRPSGQSLRALLYAVILTTALSLPLVILVSPLVFSRMDNLEQGEPKQFFPEMWDVLQLWFGPGFEVLIILGAFAIAALLWRRRLNRLEQFALFWGVLALPLMYFLDSVIGFFGQKYMSWILIGSAVFLGLMISQLPRKIQIVPVLCCCLLLTQSFPWLEQYSAWLAYRLDENLRWLRNEIYAGDVVLFAHDQECHSPFEEFDHNMNLYLTFPGGLNIVDNPAAHQRVWFVTQDGSPESPHWEALRRDYVARRYVGPPNCLFRLYEGPPEREGVLFANGMRFHGAQFMRGEEPLPPGYTPQLHEGETYRVRIWWRAEEALPLDYSVGVFLMDEEGRVIEERHGPPQPSYPAGAPAETSRWQVGQLYHEDREFTLPYPLERQQMELRLAVYYWEQPSERFTAAGTDALGLLPLFTINVMSW